MTFGETVRRYRQEKGLTQEKLGEKLGVSSQAVSKWETMDCYPDAELLVPLANELDVSLDVLFRNDRVTERDAAAMIAALIQKEQEAGNPRPIEQVRRLCWAAETAMFGELNWTPSEGGMSAVEGESGFTEISNEKDSPFFAVFTEPEKGWGEAIGNGEALMPIFAALSRENSMKALLFLMRQKPGYLFEAAVLTRETGIPAEGLDVVMEDLQTLSMVCPESIVINGEPRQLYKSCLNTRLLSVLILAKYVRYNGGFNFQSLFRGSPLIRP